MFYKKFSPVPALKPYVYGYYLLEHNHYLSTPVELHSTPSGTCGMVFNYGDAGWVEHKNGESVQMPSCFLAGQFNKNYTLRLQGWVGMIGVVFWPGALSHLLGIPMREFTEQRVELSLILGDEAKVLYEQVLEEDNPKDRIRILEQFLLKKLRKISSAIDAIDGAVSTIIDQKGMLSIRQLSDDLCISPRQLCRSFTEKVGITPKRFARIKRFNYISHLMGIDDQEWGEMVYRGGYYDQSHFIKDFCEFSGKNPSEFVNYKRALARLVEA